MTLKEVAELWWNSFEDFTRPDDPYTRLVRLKDGAPTGLQDAIREAHEDRLPDDWVYRECWGAVDAIKNDYDDLDAARDTFSEPDTYYHDRINWLAEHTGNAAIVDEAIKEFGYSPGNGILDQIGAGQRLARETIFDAILEGMNKVVDDD